MTSDVSPLPPPPCAPAKEAITVPRIAAATAAVALLAVAAWQYATRGDVLEDQRNLAAERDDLKAETEKLLQDEREINAKIAAVPPRPWGAPSAASLESHKKTLVETSEQNRQRAEQVLADLKAREETLRAEITSLQNNNIQPTTKP